MTPVTLTHEPPKFDWYQATVQMPAGDLVDLAATVLGDEAPRVVPGRHGYARGWEIRRGGSRAALVMVEGQHEHPHIVGTGDDAPAVAALVRRKAQGVGHRVARCDVAVDTDAPDAFAYLLAGLRAHAIRGGVRATLMHDPDRGDAGATYYVGAKASEVRARLYEKGKQLGDEKRSGWVRYELQLRPQKGRKTWVAVTSPTELLGAARWSRAFAGEYLGEVVPPAPARTERVSDLEGALRTMTTQYAGRLLELVEALDGDVAAVGQELLTRALNGGLLVTEDEAS